MSRYIDADKVLEKINKICNRCGKMNKNNGVMCGACYFDEAKDMIDDFPTAEVKPIVYGEWLYTGDMFNEGELVCSKCGHKIDVADKSNFCPNCGAIMRKESKE